MNTLSNVTVTPKSPEVLERIRRLLNPTQQAAGGRARAASLTPQRRSEIAKKAAAWRWKKQ